LIDEGRLWSIVVVPKSEVNEGGSEDIEIQLKMGSLDLENPQQSVTNLTARITLFKSSRLDPFDTYADHLTVTSSMPSRWNLKTYIRVDLSTTFSPPTCSNCSPLIRLLLY
uniref:ZU5 domain-containing protein n=1 Tax=Hydatigena taeniaeformis TaxID=6205 RepID=A0A0R3WX93_HYDTA